jgi:tRNA U34 5-methylaminomethyl-2-thiouridine-forming methyltransferase MnmC
MNHPLFEIVTTTLGVVSIRNKQVNEIMHNPVGPWAEANALYIRQSGLEKRLREKSGGELVLFDVGLGAAANALAALHCAAGVSGGRPLRIVSFERELELLRYALKHADKFAHFTGFTGAIETLLEKGEWLGQGVSWELRHGDFRELIKSEKRRPHLIYFDPYSSKVNREMWSVDCFKSLRAVARDEGCLLYTYSQATPVRVAILAGGFFLGRGPASGPKEETTIAATVLSDLENPMGAEWFGRWERSHLQVPFECPPEKADEMRAFVRKHPQFASARS